MEKKKIIIISVIVLVVVALIGGGSYAWFNYFQVSNVNNLLVAGDIRLKLQAGQDTLSLSNVFPETKEEARSHDDNTLTFDVNGANTVRKAIRYNVLLNHGDDIANKVRFSDDELRFDLVEIIDNNEILLVENAKFDTIANANLYDNIVPGNTNSVSHTYKLRMWIDEGVTVSETETGSHIYTPSEYKDLYATIKLSVKGETIEGDTYTLTFNPNGGTVPISTKSIVVGQDYGYLPTPTKEGYTFLGWNGKNMLSPFIIGKIFNLTDGEISNGSTSAVTDFISVDFENNESYVLTLSDKFRTMVGAYNENYEYLGRNAGARRTSLILNSSTCSYYTTETIGPTKNIKVRAYEYEGLDGDIDDINTYEYQMEPGSVATAYEPFLVTSNTKVTEWNTNYVLKAIWQEN